MAQTKRAIVSPLFQIICMMVSLLLVSYIVTYRLSIPRIIDQIPPIEPITPAKVEEYGGVPDTIEAGLHINSFSEIDLINNAFTFSGILWFYLYPQTASLSELENVTFERGTITNMSPPYVRLQGKKILVQYETIIAYFLHCCIAV